MNQHSSSKRKYYSPLIGAALAAVSLFHFSLPAFAVGTDAGLQLKNRATATYDDGTTPYEVISNEVTVTVGKIHGITNVPTTYQNNTTPGGTVLPGNSVSFDFLVTNTGNDVSKIFIPSGTVLNANATNIAIDGSSASSVQISVNGGAFFDRPADGIIDGDITGPNAGQGIPENTSIVVRVTGTVDASANVGDEIRVRLGDTGGNIADTSDPNFPSTQNQPDAGGATDPQEQDVRTLTGDNADTDVDGEPANGQREASATHLISIGSNPLALTRIEKTNSGVETSGTPTILNDDVITYNLELDVLAQKLARYNNFAFNPAALEGRDYAARVTDTVNTSITDTSNLILISDAIPNATTLKTNNLTNDVTAPAGWTAVYTKDDLTTSADQATWDTDPTAAIGAQAATDPVTRIGWVYDANSAPGNLAPGSSATGFGFKVITTGVTADNTPIYNMAQVFGSTDDGTPNAANTPSTGDATFDESGDENPNNFADDGTNPVGDLADGSGNFGSANLDKDVDTANNNTATGSLAGEVNRVIITLGAVTPDILNGPDGLPQAVGGIFSTDPADNNHDFQNLAAPIPAASAQTVDLVTGEPDSTLAAATTVTFTNTVQNTETGDIADVKLEPVLPTDLGLDPGTTATVLPDNTTIAITYNGRTVTYTKTGGTSPVLTPTTASSGDVNTPITLTVPGTGTAPVGSNSVDYTVVVTLPTGTPLSTNGDVGGYAVPIAAYVDDSTDAGATDDTPDLTDTYNVTVDQVYLGYLKLVKQARVLRDYDANGVADGVYNLVPGMDFTDPDTAKSPAPGDIIEYQVAYSNISESQGTTGSNNGILDAENVAINEDGTGTIGSTDNNWGVDGPDDNDTIIDTLHVPTEAVDSNGGTISYFNGATGSGVSNDGDKQVTRYLADVGTVVPGGSGIFTFQRKVTDEGDIEELTP